MEKNYIIAVDYDGCVVNFKDKVEPLAIHILQQLAANGHKLVLWTCRTGEWLQDAIDVFKRYRIPLHGISEISDDNRFDEARKISADFFIDDRAIGVPLKPDKTLDWEKIYKCMMEHGILPQIK